MSLYTTTQLARAGLVSFWQLGETSGTSAADSKGSNTGTYTGGFTLNQTGLLVPGGDTNPSTTLNGTTGYVTVPNNATLNTTAGVSFEMVFLANAIPGSGVAALANKMNSSIQGWDLVMNTSGQIVGYANSGNATAPGTVTVGTVHHAAVTWNPNGDLWVYLDGQASGFPGTSYTTNTDPLRIGNDAFNEFLNGRIQYASVYNRVLSPSEIKADAAITALSFPPHEVDNTFQFNGGFTKHRTTVADANYTVKNTDYIISYTSITAARTLTPPASTSLTKGQSFLIKDESGSCSATFTITWGTVDGSSLVLNSAYARAEVMWTGAAWTRIG